MDAEHFTSSHSSLPLWAPRVETPVPSVPQVSSEDAADQLDQHIRQSQNDSIILQLSLLAPGETLSRWELHQRTGIDVNVLCARLKSDLQDTGYVQCVRLARRSHKKPGLLVSGYRLNPSKVWRRASTEAIGG